MSLTSHLQADGRQWLKHARSNLALAKAKVAGVLREDLCFLAHQAADKAVKAVYVHRRMRFPYMRDVHYLLDHLRRKRIKVPLSMEEAEELTPYSVSMSFPGFVGAVSQRQYRLAVRIAEMLVRWAEREVAKG
jgi:HEPN domain-containing protein